MANSTYIERDRCLSHIGKILGNPSRANLTALVLAVRDGAPSFNPPDEGSAADSYEPYSLPLPPAQSLADNNPTPATSGLVETVCGGSSKPEDWMLDGRS